MKIFKKLFCTHDFRLKFTCTYRDGYEYKRIKIEKCNKCSKVKKSIM